MPLMKALLLGSILTFIVSMAIHGAGYAGGYLNVQGTPISGHFIYWSWPLFIVSVGLAWGILWLME